MRKVLLPEVQRLQSNKNIFKESKNSIIHTTYFKRLFTKEYMSGKLRRNIFK